MLCFKKMSVSMLRFKHVFEKYHLSLSMLCFTQKQKNECVYAVL